MADNTRSKEEIARLDARMAEMDKYLKDPKMKLGRGASGRFQFYKTDEQKQAASVSPKKTATAASVSTKTETSNSPEASSKSDSSPKLSPSPKMSDRYNEDTRTALQQLGPRRGVTTESITRPSAKDAAKIAAYKADQERQAQNVERGRDVGIALGTTALGGLGTGARLLAGAASRKAAQTAAQAATKAKWAEEAAANAKQGQEAVAALRARRAASTATKAAEAPKPAPSSSAGQELSKRLSEETAKAQRGLKARKVAEEYFGPRVKRAKELEEAARNDALRKAARAKDPRLSSKINKALQRGEITAGEAAEADLYGLGRFKKGGAVKPGKVGTVMHEFKAGKLKSSSGQKVTNPKQAVAIAMSEAGMKKAKKFGDGGMTDAEAKAYADTEVANQEALRKAREEAKKQKAPVSKRYAKGGEVGDSKAMMKKEVAFMKRKGAPKSMIKHEEKEAKGMKKGGTACYAEGGKVKKMANGGMFGAGMAPRGTGANLAAAYGAGRGPSGMGMPPRQFDPRAAAAAALAAAQGYGTGRGLGQMGMNPAVAGRLGGIGAGLMGGLTGYKKGGAIAMKKGGTAKGYAKGGAVRADGCATKGKTRCKTV